MHKTLKAKWIQDYEKEREQQQKRPHDEDGQGGQTRAAAGSSAAAKPPLDEPASTTLAATSTPSTSQPFTQTQAAKASTSAGAKPQPSSAPGAAAASQQAMQPSVSKSAAPSSAPGAQPAVAAARKHKQMSLFALDDAISLVPANKPKAPIQKKPSNQVGPSKDVKQQAAVAGQAKGSSRAQAADSQQEQPSSSHHETATSSGRDVPRVKAGAGSKQEQDEGACLSDSSQAAAHKLKKLKIDTRRQEQQQQRQDDDDGDDNSEDLSRVPRKQAAAKAGGQATAAARQQQQQQQQQQGAGKARHGEPSSLGLLKQKQRRPGSANAAASARGGKTKVEPDSADADSNPKVKPEPGLSSKQPGPIMDKRTAGMHSSDRPKKKARDTNSTGAVPRSPPTRPAGAAAGSKAEEGPLSSSSQQPGRLVECLVELQPTSTRLDLSSLRSFKDMWARLEQLVPQGLPDKLDAKIVYMDADGDWIMLQPDARWQAFASVATKILVSSRC